MSLKYSPQRAAAQTAAINALLASGLFSTSDVPLPWIEFKESIWGVGSASLATREEVKRDEPVQDYYLPDPVPDKTWVVNIPNALPAPWESLNRRILVRSEYYEAEQAVLLAEQKSKQAFLFTGHPGIGKSVLLLWILMRRLALRLPTALQTDPDHAFLFYEGGVCRFTELSCAGHYLKLQSADFDRIWALIDSNQDLMEPTPTFNLLTPFFIVEAMAPRASCLQWLRRVDAGQFCMKSWSFSEVLQARSFLGNPAPYDERQLWDFFWEYGGSPKALADHALDPDDYKDEVAKQVQALNPAVMQELFLSPFSDDRFDLVAVIEPSDNDRSVRSRSFASKRVFEMVWKRHLANNPAEGLFFYNMFQGIGN